MRYGWVGCGWRALRDCLSVVVLWLGEWKAVGGAHNNIAECVITLPRHLMVLVACMITSKEYVIA